MPSDPQPAAAPGSPSEELARRASRSVMWFAGLLLAGLWFSVLAPPWPLPLLTGVLSLAALVVGVRTIFAMLRARSGGAVLVLLVVGMLLAAFLVLVSALQAVMWPVYAELHTCLERALTVRAERACRTDLESSLQEWVWGLFGR